MITSLMTILLCTVLFYWELSAMSSPIIALLSDSHFGRYKIYSFSLYLWLMSIVFLALDLIVPSDILYLLNML